MVLGGVQNELNQAIRYVETEGQKQLTEAIKAAERYGDKSQQVNSLKV